MTTESATLPLAPSSPAQRAALRARGRRGSWASRVTWAILFALPTFVLGLSSWLTIGQLDDTARPLLGLPPCGFLVITGLPCPGCGLTHCFTSMAHFDIFGAVHANPFGVLLFLVSLTTIPVAIVGFIRNWPVIDTLERLQFDKWAILLSLASVSTWIVRVVTLLLVS